MSFLSLPDQILTQVTLNLELKDLLALGDSHTRLRDLVYKTPEIWTSDLLFPTGDTRITDKFIQRIVPRITRHYGILSLKMIHLPLTWTGYFMIFDQFAHSVKRIQINAPSETIRQLVHHLDVFAGNLAMLQQSNKIPITFRQYVFDHEEYAAELAESNYLGQSTLHNLTAHFAQIKLDDPPFERLQVFDVDVQGQDQQDRQHLLTHLELLTCFLSGRTTNKAVLLSPIPTNQRHRQHHHNNNNNMINSNKRPRDDQIISISNKYMRHETSPHTQHSNYYQYQTDHHHQQNQEQQQQQPQAQYHHRITRPYSTAATSTNYVQ